MSCTPLARGENHLVSFNRMAATFLAGMKALETNEREGNASDSKESELGFLVVVGKEGGDSREDVVDGEDQY